MLTSLDKILSIIKLAVGGLGIISLLIGAVGIFSIMSIAQQERIPEVGLLMALGCPRRRILLLFLLEAVVLALLGGAMGLALLGGLKLLLTLLAAGLPLTLHPFYLLLALGCSALVGLLAGSLLRCGLCVSTPWLPCAVTRSPFQQEARYARV